MVIDLLPLFVESSTEVAVTVMEEAPSSSATVSTPFSSITVFSDVLPETRHVTALVSV